MSAYGLQESLTAKTRMTPDAAKAAAKQCADQSKNLVFPSNQCRTEGCLNEALDQGLPSHQRSAKSRSHSLRRLLLKGFQLGVIHAYKLRMPCVRLNYVVSMNL